MPRPVYVHGAAVRMSWADASFSLEELVFQTVRAALADSGVSIESVQSVVLAAHDLVDGRSLSSMVTAPAAGAYLRDEIRVAEDGLVALSLAGARVAAGECEFSIVAAWGRASEGDLLRDSRVAMDPFMVQPFGLTEAGISAMRLSRWMGEHGAQLEARQAAVEARNWRAAANPRSLLHASVQVPMPGPLLQTEGPRLADVVSAVIIGAPVSRACLAGVGHGTDSPALGDRNWLARPALSAAVSQALSEARWRLSDINLFEIDGMTLADEALALEALGLAQAGQGFEVYAGSAQINPAGGSAAGWCYPAMGLVRFAECLFRLRASGAGRGLAVGASPIGAQTHTAAALELS